MLKPLYWTGDFVRETGNGMDVVTDYRFGHRCNYCQIAAPVPVFSSSGRISSTVKIHSGMPPLLHVPIFKGGVKWNRWSVVKNAEFISRIRKPWNIPEKFSVAGNTAPLISLPENPDYCSGIRPG